MNYKPNMTESRSQEHSNSEFIVDESQLLKAAASANVFETITTNAISEESKKRSIDHAHGEECFKPVTNVPKENVKNIANWPLLTDPFTSSTSAKGLEIKRFKIDTVKQLSPQLEMIAPASVKSMEQLCLKKHVSHIRKNANKSQFDCILKDLNPQARVAVLKDRNSPQEGLNKNTFHSTCSLGSHKPNIEENPNSMLGMQSKKSLGRNTEVIETKSLSVFKETSEKAKKRLVQLKLFKTSEQSPFTELSNQVVQELERQLHYSRPMEIDIILQSAGDQLFSVPACRSKTSYVALYFRIQWSSEDSEYYRTEFKTELWSKGRQNLKALLQSMFTLKHAVVCIEAAELIVFLIRKLQFNKSESHKWNIMDPLVAYWMIHSDEPCASFEHLVEKLQLDRSDMKNNFYGSKTCKFLDLLSKGFGILKQMLKKEHVWTLFLEMEVKLTPLLGRMTHRGIHIQDSELRSIGELIAEKLISLEREGHKAAGRPFSINSPQQLRKILYDDLKLQEQFNIKVKDTATGAKSTSETVLKLLVPHHSLPGIVLEYRRLQKLKSTYIDGIINFVRKGTVNCIWEQRSAATGRLVSTNPNLQAIPTKLTSFKTDQGKEVELNIRSLFRPRKGYVFLMADFQHIEFRIFANLTDDSALIDVFKQSDDVFMSLAEHWLGKDGHTICASDREKTKRIVYSLMYGAGTGKIADQLNVSIFEASVILNSFYAKFPKLQHLNKKVSEQCSKQGYVRTVQGRIRKLPHICDMEQSVRAQAERQAVNFVIQGAAADLCKQAMLLTENQFVNAYPPIEAHLLLQIHDELVWEVAESDVKRAQEIAKRVMEDAEALNGYIDTFKVPIRVKFHILNSLYTGTSNSQNED